MRNEDIPKLIIVGDSAYDTNLFNLDNEQSYCKTNLGGSSIYASIPASSIYRVGLVSNVGEDFEIEKLSKYNIDLSGVTIHKGEKTSRFYNILNTKDQQDRKTRAEYNEKLTPIYEDIPYKFFNSNFFYISTMLPKKQKDIIKKIKEKCPNSVIGVDTFEGYSELDETLEVFNMADITFIDKEFSKLLQNKAKTKIIKLGKEGCILIDNGKKTLIEANTIENVVDKTGAGDCLNGVFMNLIAHGHSKKESLEIAVKIATLSITEFGILNINERIKKEINIDKTLC